MQTTEERSVTRQQRHAPASWRLQRLLAQWPFVVWVILTALCSFLYVRTTQYGIITATAQAIHHDAAPLQAARVKDIYVQIGSHVTNGQVVAQMDTSVLETQVAEAEAALAGAESTMEAYQAQMLTQVRAVDDEILRAQHALSLQRSQQESDLAKLAQLKAIQGERDKLAKSNLITEQLADALRPEIAWLEKQVAAYPEHIAVEERILADAKKHKEDLQKTLRLGPQEDILKAVADKTAAQTKILSAVVEMRKQERELYALRAEADGVVSDIRVFPGAVASPGQPVVGIVSKSDLIIGFLPEIRLGRLKVGDHGYAFRMGHASVSVKVLEIVPEVVAVPTKLSPISAPLGATLRSQKVVFRTETPSDITAGEKVEIRMESPNWAKAKRWLLSLRQ